MSNVLRPNHLSQFTDDELYRKISDYLERTFAPVLLLRTLGRECPLCELYPPTPKEPNDAC